MEFRKAELCDVKIFQQSAVCNNLFSNNYSGLNSFLYRNKYCAKISIHDNWLYERYFFNGDESSVPVFSFPHNITGDNSQIKEKLKNLGQESKTIYGKFILSDITQEDKQFLLEVFPNAVIQEARDLSDYIYLTENLSLLGGKKLSAKRNHIHRFYKKYQNCEFHKLSLQNLKIVSELEEKWVKESEEWGDDKTFLQSLYDEQKMINEALENFDYLLKEIQFTGLIGYADGMPFAFCLSSRLSEDVTDIHFEKCLSSFARDGGYAVINNECAKTITTKYINREEDLGIEGLRKAKLSYYPEIIIPKFNAEIL